MSIPSEAGCTDKPGMSIISPITGIKKPAPAAISIFPTVIIKSFGHSKSVEKKLSTKKQSLGIYLK
jgi:hypothetical protein